MRKDKKYAMIIFMEDERYNGKEYDCDFYASAPWVGNFLDMEIMSMNYGAMVDTKGFTMYCTQQKMENESVTDVLILILLIPKFGYTKKKRLRG